MEMSLSRSCKGLALIPHPYLLGEMIIHFSSPFSMEALKPRCHSSYTSGQVLALQKASQMEECLLVTGKALGFIPNTVK